MTEQPAKGVKGFFLYNPFTERHFFRVYDPDNKRQYKDYVVSAEDIEVEILAGGLSLYHDGKSGRLDWASRYLRRPETKSEGEEDVV